MYMLGQALQIQLGRGCMKFYNVLSHDTSNSRDSHCRFHPDGLTSVYSVRRYPTDVGQKGTCTCKFYGDAHRRNAKKQSCIFVLFKTFIFRHYCRVYDKKSHKLTKGGFDFDRGRPIFYKGIFEVYILQLNNV